MTLLAVAVCTWNNAESLDRVLDALASQSTPLPVLVVDNNSTDHTAAVVRSQAQRTQGLRSVVEPVQGLTPARLRAVQELASAEWIAFVDDDCLLAPDWSTIAERVCDDASAEITGIGGEVELRFDTEPPAWIHSIRGAYAEQHPRFFAGPVETLVGAGMICRRNALVSSGWTDGPLLDDRRGLELISGGDVELAMRLAAHGQLWYDPSLRLRHQIPCSRTTVEYALRLQRGLGAAALAVHQMRSSRGPRAWQMEAAAIAVRHLTSSWLRPNRRELTMAGALAHAYWRGWADELHRQRRTHVVRDRLGAANRW